MENRFTKVCLHQTDLVTFCDEVSDFLVEEI